MSKVQIFSFVARSLYFCSNTSGILKINLWLYMLGFWWWKKRERETRETGENRGQYQEEDGGGGAVTVQFPKGEGQGEGAAQKGRGGPAVQRPSGWPGQYHHTSYRYTVYRVTGIFALLHLKMVWPCLEYARPKWNLPNLKFAQ